SRRALRTHVGAPRVQAMNPMRRSFRRPGAGAMTRGSYPTSTARRHAARAHARAWLRPLVAGEGYARAARSGAGHPRRIRRSPTGRPPLDAALKFTGARYMKFTPDSFDHPDGLLEAAARLTLRLALRGDWVEGCEDTDDPDDPDSWDSLYMRIGY